MLYRIEVRYREDIPDAQGRGIVEDVRDLGIAGVERVRVVQVYWLKGDLTEAAVKRICVELLTDAVTQVYRYQEVEDEAPPPSAGDTARKATWIVEVRYRPGVTDAVGDSVMKGLRDMGIDSVQEVHTGTQYLIQGQDLSYADVVTISKRLLANELIQTITIR